MTFKNYLKGYKLIYSSAAQKTLKNCDIKLALKIEEKLKQLISGQEGLDIKKLKAYDEPTYRLRVGFMRILFTIWNRQLMVYVVEIEHRKNIYD